MPVLIIHQCYIDTQNESLKDAMLKYVLSMAPAEGEDPR